VGKDLQRKSLLLKELLYHHTGGYVVCQPVQVAVEGTKQERGLVINGAIKNRYRLRTSAGVEFGSQYCQGSCARVKSLYCVLARGATFRKRFPDWGGASVMTRKDTQAAATDNVL
jgi:hypothetical protein